MVVLRKKQGEQCHEDPALNISVLMTVSRRALVHTDPLCGLQAMTKGGDILQVCYRWEHERAMRVSRDHPATGCPMTVLFQAFLGDILVQETYVQP